MDDPEEIALLAGSFRAHDALPVDRNTAGSTIASTIIERQRANTNQAMVVAQID